jgi:thymidylate synthase
MKLYEDLKETYPDLGIGSIIWCPDSFHVYERHFNMLEKMATEPLPKRQLEINNALDTIWADSSTTEPSISTLVEDFVDEA